MKSKWKSAVALLMAVSMIPTSVPVNAMEVKTAVNRTPQVNDEKQNEDTKEKNYAEGEAIILYKSGSAAAKSISAGKSLGVDIEIKETYEFVDNKVYSSANSKSVSESNIAVSLVKSDKYSTEELINTLKKRSDIKYAEPNYKIKAMDTQDSYEKYQWALENTGQNGGTSGCDINADTQALKISVNDDEKVIALVDTGIDYTHEDLKDVVWNNPFNSKQLKGEHGYDFINYDEDPLDDNGHGSHCSGIMAATSDNGVGIAGTAKSSNIKIMGLKILDEYGYGYGMEAIGAYNYIYKAQKMGVNVVAVNNSWGAVMDDEEYEEDSESSIMLEIINMVGEAGALFICAAGNEAADNDTVETIPANLDSPYVISVAATNEKDELAAFSNYGNNVDIAAPGTNILSTVSYDTFNPVLYENKDEICSLYEDFENVNLVQVMEDSTMTDKILSEGEIGYGIDSDGNGKMSVGIDEDTYFGFESEGTKSVKWTIEGAKAGDIYTLYLPYTAEVSSTPLYSSVMAKVSGPSGAGESIWGEDESVLYVSDGELDKDGSYNEDNEIIIGGTYIDDGNYWNLCTGQAEKRIIKEQQRAISVQVWAGADGDYTVHIDKMGVSKSNITSESFGKYDFYNGTSMATPYVSGAVAAVADSFDDETALGRKARILGSVRKCESLKNKTKTEGVLDLSKIENPEMSLEKANLNEDKQIEIQGYYLEGVTIKIDGESVTPIEQTDNIIVIDGAKYINRSISIQVEKGDIQITKSYFFMSGEGFEAEDGLDGYLDGGSVVSTGENLYYVDREGYTYKGILSGEGEIKKLQLEYSDYQYSTSLFGDDYKTAVDYTMTNNTDIICINKKIYTVLKIDVGYSESSILVSYDDSNGWKKYADIPEEYKYLSGVIIAAYNGKIYLMGGFDEEKETFSNKVKYYDESSEEWIEVSNMPEKRAFSKAAQVEDKLVVTLGSNGKYDVPKNLIFDGEKWTNSEAALEVVEQEVYDYETKDGERTIPITTAQTGLVKGGIVYTDLKVEDLGDTFIYNLSTDKYSSTGYCINSESLDGNQLYATTVQDKLYVLYGWEYSEEDWDIEFWKSSLLDYEDYPYWDWEEEWEYDINVCTMPVESGFVCVKDMSDINASVLGAGYYLPGDIINLEASTFDEFYIKSFTVNGKKINADSNGKYIYTTTADGSTYEIEVLAKSGVYVSEVYLNNSSVKLEKSDDASKNSCYLYAEVFPTTSEGAEIKWRTSDASVAIVDEYGKVTVASSAKPGQKAVISATAADRGIVSAKCVVTIVKESVKKGSQVNFGNFTYKVDNFTSKNKTVTCMSFNNKNATKATIPSTVKIDGYTFKVTKIAANAFKDCKKLKSVTIGKNVTSIGKNAFKNCKKLKKVTFKSSKIKTFGKDLFKGTSKKLTVKVPKKLKKSYSKKLKKAGFKGKVK